MYYVNVESDILSCRSGAKLRVCSLCRRARVQIQPKTSNIFDCHLSEGNGKPLKVSCQKNLFNLGHSEPALNCRSHMFAKDYKKAHIVNICREVTTL